MTGVTPARLGSALVLGAGIVGVTAALALQRDGFAVTLLDRGAPGEACSLGNAGHLGTASVLPQAAPGIARTVPRLLRDKQGPLAVRWGYVARNLPWFLHFLRAGERHTAERTAEMMAVLLAQVGDSYAPLLQEAGAADLVTPSGLLHVFRTEAALRGGQWGYDLRRRLGIAVCDVSAEETRALEPCLAGPIAGGVLLPDVATVRDPLEMTRRFLALFERRGGTVLCAPAREVVLQNGQARGRDDRRRKPYPGRPGRVIGRRLVAALRCPPGGNGAGCGRARVSRHGAGLERPRCGSRCCWPNAGLP